MADGQNANVGFNSYLAVGRETTFKTYNTCTAGLNFLSSSLKTIQENKILEEITTKRTYANRVNLSKAVAGEISFYFGSADDASNYILGNAFGGGVPSSATGTGETVGGGSFEHTYSINAFAVTYSSLCLNARKGDSTNGQIWEYNGVRVNELSFAAEIDDALVCNASVIAVDSTVTSNNVASALTVTGHNVLNFDDMRLSVEATFASLTASAFWHVQNIEFGVTNNLKSDTGSRRLGSNILDVLPPGVAAFTFNFTMRFDTLTAYNAMLNETQYSAQLSFQGPTIAGSSLRRELRIDMPKIFISDAGDPEVAGPDEILSSPIVAHVLRDDTSAGGYAVQAVVRNTSSGYA